jgi:uncharacterized protein YbjQ (UPF0145 family)
MEPQGRVRVWTSGLSADDAASVRAAGFEPAGQVMGAVVLDFTPWLSKSGERESLYGEGRGRYYVSGVARKRLTYASALRGGRKTSIARMTAECAALGGDGVVAVTSAVSGCPWDQRAVTFTAIGTAVRARGSVRAPAPFAAHLSGPDFAKLIMNGLVPAGIAIGVGEDWGYSHAGAAARRLDPNREITRWTDAVTAARGDARDRMLSDARLIGGDGVVLSMAETRVHLDRTGSRRAGEGACIAEATFIGTVIAAFGRHGQDGLAALPILRLNEPPPPR